MSEHDDDAPEVLVDVEEWQGQLRLPANTAADLASLEERLDNMNRKFGELLIYANMLDDRVRQLAGERILTTTVQSHVGSDGVAKVHRMRPEAPDMESIVNPKKLIDKNEDASRLARMVVKP